MKLREKQIQFLKSLIEGWDASQADELTQMIIYKEEIETVRKVLSELQNSENGGVNMDLVEMICKELDIELGEEWVGSDGETYRVNDGGCINKLVSISTGVISETWEPCQDIIYKKILIGELRPIYRPKEGDMPWVVDLDIEEKVKCVMWIDDSIQYDRWLERGMVFKTKEEAKEKANEILKMLGE